MRDARTAQRHLPRRLTRTSALFTSRSDVLYRQCRDINAFGKGAGRAAIPTVAYRRSRRVQEFSVLIRGKTTGTNRP